MKKYNYSRLNQRDLEGNQGLASTSSTCANGATIIDTGMYLRDWRQALRTPPSYRLGNRTIRLQVHLIWPLAVLGAIVVLLVYIISSSPLSSGPSINDLDKSTMILYNHTYPLSSPIVSNGMYTYRIGIIADLDTSSRVEGKDAWSSYLMKGYLSYVPSSGTVTVSWDETKPKELRSSFSLKGRGMELSELVVFNGKLLTFDDRTGLVYVIDQDKVYPWLLLMDGDGKASKGFKSEWATVKDQVLYVGSMGKEWTTAGGDFENNNPMFVKAVTVHGEVYHLDWSTNFKALRSAIGIDWPGYMIHESGVWSSESRRWFFLPRRCSKERYNETRDEHMGCNYLITADESFHSIKPLELKRSNVSPTHGFSSFKFLPNTDERIIIALSTEELNGKTSSFISVFGTNGDILMPETRIPTNYKFEGLEFI
ncbi:soluble calcium-activated nucleotidase 1 [Topomyia yanbarensis]|uniref:soluble calcium-activated nucleotidase 1 n=1 Tax=Topomyia yanbarensis TaxID=2498891 RepID=UPI00273CC29F|nr:soluble calcium-activated nucleotidase 1 [Topomyia yanbarensis]